MTEKDQSTFVIQPPGESGFGCGINTYKKCPECNGTNFVVRDHDPIWHDGKVYCVDCNVFVRYYDAG